MHGYRVPSWEVILKNIKVEDITKIHKGIYCFLMKQGCNIHNMRRMLALYGESIEMQRPRKERHKWYAQVSNKAQEDFVEFKKFFNKHKGILSIKQSYDEWWMENNLDGSFAYNGVTEDF